MSFEIWQLIAMGVLCALAGAILGGMVTQRFGDNWLAMVLWLVGDEEVELVARLLWRALLDESALATKIWRSENAFVAWVLSKAHALKPSTEKISAKEAELNP